MHFVHVCLVNLKAYDGNGSLQKLTMTCAAVIQFGVMHIVTDGKMCAAIPAEVQLVTYTLSVCLCLAQQKYQLDKQ